MIFVFILIFLGLGTWQLHRKAQKEELLQALSESQKAPFENIDTLETPKLFQPLYAEGHFVPSRTLFLQAKTYKGKSGVYVLGVFQTLKGKFFLVQRGWSATEKAPLPSGPLKVIGIARIPSPPTFFQPANSPPTYFWIDLKSFSQDLDVSLLPYYLVAKTSNDPHIIPTEALPLVRNHHLQYAITWYSLAFVLGMMLWWSRKHYWKKENA